MMFPGYSHLIAWTYLQSLSTSPLFSPGGKAKCVRGASVRGGPAAVFLVVLAAGSFVSCGKQAASAPPAPRLTIAAQPQPPEPPAGPVSEPQTTARLPPVQPIPEGAVPEGPTPLAGKAGRLPPGPPADTEDEQPAEVNDVGASGGAPAPRPPARPVPRLGQVLTTQQRRELNQTIDRSLDAAQRSVAAVVKQTLSADQVNSVRRIRAFVRQARETREQDLALAKNLADRARLLAQDLERGLR